MLQFTVGYDISFFKRSEECIYSFNNAYFQDNIKTLQDNKLN